MILPIYAYGQPVLKKVANLINKDYAQISTLISDMFETMYQAQGVGLAAPQIGLSINLFIVDTLQLSDPDNANGGIKQVFINGKILEEFGELKSYEEGCLSIPDIRGDVERMSKIKFNYFDENFVEYIEEFEGIHARVIQHEYDHVQGKLFIDQLKPLKKKLIQRKLDNIKNGQVQAAYRLKFMKQ